MLKHWFSSFLKRKSEGDHLRDDECHTSSLTSIFKGLAYVISPIFWNYKVYHSNCIYLETHLKLTGIEFHISSAPWAQRNFKRGFYLFFPSSQVLILLPPSLWWSVSSLLPSSTEMGRKLGPERRQWGRRGVTRFKIHLRGKVKRLC